MVTVTVPLFSGEPKEHARPERVVRVREARRDLRQGQGQHDDLPPRGQEGQRPLTGSRVDMNPDSAVK